MLKELQFQLTVTRAMLGRAFRTIMREGVDSGEFGFVDTYSYWPITHMVAPKEDALACDNCHARQGRMEDIDGVYVLGRDETPSIDRIMLLILAATLLGILGHGLVRVLFGKKGEH